MDGEWVDPGRQGCKGRALLPAFDNAFTLLGSKFLVIFEVVGTQKGIHRGSHHLADPTGVGAHGDKRVGGKQRRLVCARHRDDKHSHFQHSVQTRLCPAKKITGDISSHEALFIREEDACQIHSHLPGLACDPISCQGGWESEYLAFFILSGRRQTLPSGNKRRHACR